MTDSPVRPSPVPKPATTSRRGPSRRWFLAGGAAVVVGGAGGAAAAVELRKGPPRPRPNPAPAALVSAVARERSLIAGLDATTGGPPAIRAVIVNARADHAVHLAAFEQLLARYDQPNPAALGGSSGSPSVSASAGPTGAARTAAELAEAERAAATAYASGAASSDGRLAVVFASAAACESSHAALLS